MRAIVFAILLAFSSLAQATLIQIDVVGVPQYAGHWTFDGPAPSEISVSVLLDTTLASSNFNVITGANGVRCIGHYDSSLSGEILDVSADGRSLAGGLRGSSAASGDFPSANCNEDRQSFFSALSISAGDSSLSFTYDPFHALSLSDWSSYEDPLAALLLSTQIRGFGSFLFSSPLGMAGGAFGDATFRVREVPEPAALSLLLLGLAGLAVHRRASRAL